MFSLLNFQTSFSSRTVCSLTSTIYKNNFFKYSSSIYAIPHFEISIFIFELTTLPFVRLWEFLDFFHQRHRIIRHYKLDIKINKTQKIFKVMWLECWIVCFTCVCRSCRTQFSYCSPTWLHTYFLDLLKNLYHHWIHLF